MKFKRGFTLIELLVVIAIIGILASIVLASLNTARSKAKDAAGKATLSQARAEAELWYDDHDNAYTGACATGGTGDVRELAQDAQDQVKIDTTNPIIAECIDSALAYAAEIELNPAGSYFCVDSTGAAKEVTAVLGTATVCP